MLLDTGDNLRRIGLTISDFSLASGIISKDVTFAASVVHTD
jgi:hypothetical protein